jgi:RHS repeat-associated protein
MLLPNRHEAASEYRYAFNGMETDKEVSGQGNSYTTQFRQYDPRLGRWKSLDPLAGKYPNQSPFNAFNDNPLYFTDPLGLEGGGPGDGNDGSSEDKAEEVSTVEKGRETLETKTANGDFSDHYFKTKGARYKATYNDDGTWEIHIKRSGEYESLGKAYKPKSTPPKIKKGGASAKTMVQEYNEYMAKEKTVSEIGRDFLKDKESLKLKAYDLKDGRITIGYGTSWSYSESPYKVGDEITREQAEKYFDDAMDAYSKKLNSVLKVNLSQNQFDALIIFLYNTTSPDNDWSQNHTIKLINEGNFEEAVNNMSLFTKATINGKKTELPGLVKRRAWERNIWENSIYHMKHYKTNPTYNEIDTKSYHFIEYLKD